MSSDRKRHSRDRVLTPANIRRLYAVLNRLQGMYWSDPVNRQWIGESLTDLQYVISTALDELDDLLRGRGVVDLEGRRFAEMPDEHNPLDGL